MNAEPTALQRLTPHLTISDADVNRVVDLLEQHPLTVWDELARLAVVPDLVALHIREHLKHEIGRELHDQLHRISRRNFSIGYDIQNSQYVIGGPDAQHAMYDITTLQQLLAKPFSKPIR